MAEPSGSKELPDWIKNHLERYIATNGEDGYLWDASLGGGKGMVPTLLLTTTGRKSGRELTLPLIFGTSGPDYVVVASKGGAPGASGLVSESRGQPDSEGASQGRQIHRTGTHGQRAGTRRALAQDGGNIWALRRLPEEDRPADSGRGVKAGVTRASSWGTDAAVVASLQEPSVGRGTPARVAR